jgi:hypothetical protein
MDRGDDPLIRIEYQHGKTVCSPDCQDDSRLIRHQGIATLTAPFLNGGSVPCRSIQHQNPIAMNLVDRNHQSPLLVQGPGQVFRIHQLPGTKGVVKAIVGSQKA